eukprot:TRINITY_DN17941_c0_g1_i5.p1 TRINITY_DN17941_c0_g1~~TRINITY_DN17941_c0_g1_i5.p1  ORF type:complete len:629 (+),score=99.95 TRINITY_DN17941_c0_g1_i5:203-2089(+)
MQAPSGTQQEGGDLPCLVTRVSMCGLAEATVSSKDHWEDWAAAMEDCFHATELLERGMDDTDVAMRVQALFSRFVAHSSPLRDEMADEPTVHHEALCTKLVHHLSILSPLLGNVERATAGEPECHPYPSADRVEVTALAMHVLGLCIRHPKNHAATRAAGGWAMAVEVMSSFAHEAEIQKAGCFLLRNLAFYSDLHEPHWGVLRAIVDAMVRFPNDVEMQLKACAALRNLSSTRESTQYLHEETHEILSRTVAKYAQNSTVLESIVNVWRNLAADEAIASHYMAGGSEAEPSVVQQMITCIQQPLNVEVTIAALNALNQIASHGQVFKNALSSLGVLQLVSSHHSLNPSPSHLRSVTVHKSRLYLAMGVVCDTTRGLALELGLVSSTIMFMCDFPHEPELQQAGCALLANLACGSDLGKQQVVDEGGIELVVQAMHHHARHALLQRFSCMVLSNIHTVNSATRMLEAGVVESTRKAMQHFESNHELWEASAKLLYRMVSRAQLRAEEMLQAQRENAAMTQHDPYPSPSSSPDQQCQLIIPSDQTRQAQLDSDIMEVSGTWIPRALSLIHISEPTRLLSISYAVFCLKKKKTHTTYHSRIIVTKLTKRYDKPNIQEKNVNALHKISYTI